jgi:hypothetical protein
MFFAPLFLRSCKKSGDKIDLKNHIKYKDKYIYNGTFKRTANSI